MLCKIADLITEVPEAGGMAPRCREYLWEGEAQADIVIRTELYAPEKYPSWYGEEAVAYVESGRQFAVFLMEHGGFYLHASAVELEGQAYLFSGKSGEGKSTHTRLWQQVFGEAARVINDDKPALRRMDGQWFAYGTPWCGKDGINQNRRAPLAGICFLKQAKENRIRRLSAQEALQKLLSQTIRKFRDVQRLDLLLEQLDDLVRRVPVYELENRPEAEAARLSFETMRPEAREKK